MHALVVFSSLLLGVVAGYVTLGTLHRVEPWRQRRGLQLLVLGAPTVSLSVGVIGLHHVAGRICFLTAPPWEYTLGTITPVAVGLVAFGALGLGVVRAGLMSWMIMQHPLAAAPDLQALANRLADRLRVPRPRVRLCVSNRPLALVWGVGRSTLLLSTWMVDNLDSREMESVLAHELGHVARHDYPVVWLATVLRDAFFYLPPSQRAYQQLQREKEVACDDLAVSVTKRPLALASALAKVWQYALDGPSPGMAHAFADAGEWIEGRIERLVNGATPEPVTPLAPRLRGAAFGIGTAAFVGFMAVGAIALVAIFLNPMTCGPMVLLGKVL